MKVCFISRSAYPLFNSNCKVIFGGAEVDIFTIASELAKDPKYQVSVLVGDFGQPDAEIQGNLTLYKSYKFTEVKILQMVKLARKMLFINADIYVQESASGGTGLVAVICKLMRRKFIYRTASSIDSDGTFIKEHLLEGFVYRYGLKNASHVVTQTESDKEELIKNFGVKSSVIRNALRLPESIENNRHTVLWVGRSEKLKQPHLFIELAKAFPQEKFVMICPPADFNSVDWTRLQEEAHQISNLEFIPYVSFAEIGTYFSKVAIFVNTSKYEGFPNTFVQAASYGVAILSLNVNPDDFLTVYSCGVYAEGDFTKMQDALHQLLNSRKDHLFALQTNARKYATANHDIKCLIHLYKDLFAIYA
jgi:glycosyltransferase involved in cell wall biosynthesis